MEISAAEKKLFGGIAVYRTIHGAFREITIHSWVAGIGGVHRGGEGTMDVSADLTELGRTPVTVICAGAKSILDIPRTLEYLETQVILCRGT